MLNHADSLIYMAYY